MPTLLPRPKKPGLRRKILPPARSQRRFRLRSASEATRSAEKEATYLIRGVSLHNALSVEEEADVLRVGNLRSAKEFEALTP